MKKRYIRLILFIIILTGLCFIVINIVHEPMREEADIHPSGGGEGSALYFIEGEIVDVNTKDEVVKIKTEKMMHIMQKKMML
ncbi:hypothetical protein LJC51_09095 [Lachnospiraceae bacterium OttesenSCG-928-J05]|nr:hypothetical protein [Lachnospiraceae bacterium OttesenSCG-928-J05]